MKLRGLFLFLWTALLSMGTFCFLQPVREKTFPAWGYNVYLRNAHHVLHIHHAFHMVFLAVVILIITYLSNGHFTSPVLVLLGFLLGGSLSDFFYDDIREWKWAVSPSAYLNGVLSSLSPDVLQIPGFSLSARPCDSSTDPYTDSSQEQPQEQYNQN
jgi:hypothetical protein